jgi:hypothetical protein
MIARRALPLTVLALTLPVLAACSSSSSPAAEGVNVQAGADICSVAPAEVKAGPISVNVNWVGEGPGTVSLYAEADGAFTVLTGQVGDLTDGGTTSFTADVTTGQYEISCAVGSGADTRRPLVVS